jgi:hypothetical protein
MAILFADGFETGNYAGWASTTVVGTGATLAANAASAWAGSFGSDAHVNGASGDSAYAGCASQSTTTSKLSAQCRFKVHQNNIGTGQVYLLLLHDAGDTKGSQIVNAGGTWQMLITTRAGGTQTQALTQQTFTIDTWYLLEFLADWSGANVVYSTYINGVLDSTSTDSSVGSNIVWAKVLGGIYTASATAGVFETYTDEYKLADAYIGAGGGVPFEMQQEALVGGFRHLSGGLA